MKKKFRILATLFLAPTLWAQNLDIKTIQADFTQSITNDQNAVVTYQGKMYATQEKNQALWEYKVPIIKQIYYKEGKLVIIEPELEQVIYAKLDKIPNILALLKSAKKISENTLQTTFNALTYNITLKEGKLEKIFYKDEMQNSVMIVFQNEVVNDPIQESRFSYTIPKGYDILEE